MRANPTPGATRVLDRATTGRSMGRGLLLVCVALVLLVLPWQAAEGQQPPVTPPPDGGRPNVLFILADDQSRADAERMGSLKRLVTAKGAKMGSAYATTPLCCPSRASFLTGRYTGNHGVLSNRKPYAWDKFRSSGQDGSTVATWLDGSGYRVGYAGKYMNNYGGQENLKTTNYIPPGYDRWWSWQGGRNEFGTSYKINDNGRITTHDATALHETDYLAAKAEAFVRNGANAKAPWFFTLSTNAPHTPYRALGRHTGDHADAPMPTPPNYREADVSDKPRWVRDQVPSETHEEAVTEWRKKMDDQEFVDDAVEGLVATLRQTGQLDETYIIYASDNGCANYANRIYCKEASYEPSIGIPMSIKGPGIAPHQNGALVGNIDVAPTIADWAGVEAPSSVDGRSMVPILENPGGATPWRRALMVEFYSDHPYAGILEAHGTRYFEHETGEREHYDLIDDPWQLENTYGSLPQAERDRLSARLDELRACSGGSCRVADR